MLQFQAPEDADYFIGTCQRTFTSAKAERVRNEVLNAYRWQYIVSGLKEPRFAEFLRSLVSASQKARIGRELAPIMARRGQSAVGGSPATMHAVLT